MGQPEEAVGPWKQEENQHFVDELNTKVWTRDTKFDGIVLQAACPICYHADGINVFVPIVIAGFRESTPLPTQFIECKCVENHDGRPTGQFGCGRWGMVTPKTSEG